MIGTKAREGFILSAVEYKIRATQRLLLWERIIQSFLPFLICITISSSLIVLSAGYLFASPGWINTLSLIASLIALAFLFVGTMEFFPPDRADAISRMDEDHAGRPLSQFHDKIILGALDKASLKLWNRHINSLLPQLSDIKIPSFQPRLAKNDPLGLRYFSMPLLLLALIFGSNPFIDSRSLGRQNAQAARIGSWEGWITPPPYTGLPVLYLPELTEGRIDLPSGSEIALRLYELTRDEINLEQSIGATHQMQEDLLIINPSRSGSLSLRPPNAPQMQWNIALLQDHAPSITMIGEMERFAKGQFRVVYSAEDDYGIEAAELHLELALNELDRRYWRSAPPDDPTPVRLNLPLPSSLQRAQFEREVRADLSLHPFAGMPAYLSLKARDHASNETSTEPKLISFPGRRFFDPVAAAIAEQRQAMLWARVNRPEALRQLRAILASSSPTEIRATSLIELKLMIQRMERRLEWGTTSDTDFAQDAETLWRIAVEIEEGSVLAAKAALDRARLHLEQAMRRGASPSEIEELTKRYRDALENYLQELARNSADESTETSPSEETLNIGQNDIRQMLEALESLMKEGRMDEAAELMQELSALLENLQVQQGTSQETGEGTPSEDLGNMLDEQQELADDIFRDLQEQSNPSEENPGSEEFSERQNRLLQDLEETLPELPAPGTEEGDAARSALDRARKAMEQAENALRDENNSGDALDLQADAIEALREAMRALQQNAQPSPPGGQNPDSGSGQLGGGSAQGRNGHGGVTGGETNSNPTPDSRAEELQNEIRRRSAEENRPTEELEYYDRLLNPEAR